MMRTACVLATALLLAGCVQLSPGQTVGVCRTVPMTLHVILDNAIFGISEIEEQNLSGVWTVNVFQGLDGRENEKDVAIPQNTDFLRVNGALYRVKALPSCETFRPQFLKQTRP